MFPFRVNFFGTPEKITIWILYGRLEGKVEKKLLNYLKKRDKPEVIFDIILQEGREKGAKEGKRGEEKEEKETTRLIMHFSI